MNNEQKNFKIFSEIIVNELNATQKANLRRNFRFGGLHLKSNKFAFQQKGAGVYRRVMKELCNNPLTTKEYVINILHKDFTLPLSSEAAKAAEEYKERVDIPCIPF